MTPQEAKQKAVELSGNTRVTMPVYTLIAIASVLLGVRYMERDRDQSVKESWIEPVNELRKSFDSFVAIQGAKLNKAEQDIIRHNGAIDAVKDNVIQNREDIKAIEQRLNQTSPFGGQP